MSQTGRSHDPPPPPPAPESPSASPRPLARKESMKSYIASGHGTLLPLRRRLRHALTSTPLLDRIPQIRFIAAPSPSASLGEAPRTQLSDAPLSRLWHDVCTFFQCLEYLPYALLPLGASRGRFGDGDDDDWKGDHESWRTKRDDVLVGTASVMQVLSLPLVPVAWAVLPGLAFLAVALVAGGVNYGLLRAIQGDVLVRSSRVPVGSCGEVREREGERWFFVNGIMTGYVGVQSAVDHLSFVFRRPILGVHNRTAGFVGDIVECLIQRCFTYNTEDVRVAYDSIRSCLIDPKVKKIVLLAHSQGGITASMVLDKLLTELPRDCLGKLEIYTFGSAASHFSNPLLSTPPEQSSGGQAPQMPDLSSRVARPFRTPFWPANSVQTDTSTGNHPTKRTIPYIEHYANELDPITRWGVLHSVKDLSTNLYAGSIFVRLGASGHLFSKHYLAAIFPADEDERCLFWDRIVQTTSPEPSKHGEVQWGDGVDVGKQKLNEVNEGRENADLGDVKFVEGNKTMRELGRLCAYVDGGIPDEQ